MPKASSLPKNKEGKSLITHPNSRKTKQMAKKCVKLNAREKSKKVQQVKQTLICEKLLWFQQNLQDGIPNYSALQTLELMEKYLKRFEEELEQIAIKHSIGQRKNRQHASREDIIKLTVAQDNEEFRTCGIEVPDIMNPAQMTVLRNWNGEARFLPNFTLKRYSRPNLLQAIKKEEVKKSDNNSGSSKSKLLDSASESLKMDTN